MPAGAALGISRDEAIECSMALNRSQVRLVGLIVNPKRSWHPSARAMAAVGYWHELDGLIKLHEALCKAYGIGGY